MPRVWLQQEVKEGFYLLDWGHELTPLSVGEALQAGLLWVSETDGTRKTSGYPASL